MRMRKNNVRRIEIMSNLLWLLVPERPLSELCIFAEKAQYGLMSLIKLVEDQKTAAVDTLYYKFHESEDV